MNANQVLHIKFHLTLIIAMSYAGIAALEIDEFDNLERVINTINVDLETVKKLMEEYYYER